MDDINLSTLTTIHTYIVPRLCLCYFISLIYNLFRRQHVDKLNAAWCCILPSYLFGLIYLWGSHSRDTQTKKHLVLYLIRFNNYANPLDKQGYNFNTRQLDKEVYIVEKSSRPMIHTWESWLLLARWWRPPTDHDSWGTGTGRRAQGTPWWRREAPPGCTCPALARCCDPPGRPGYARLAGSPAWNEWRSEDT